MYNDKKFRSLIRICWIVLFIVWIFCIFSGKYLNIVIENKQLLKLQTILDRYECLDLIVRFLMYYFEVMLIYYAILQREIFSYKTLPFTIIIFSCWSLKTLLINYSLSNYIDIFTILIILIFDVSKWKRVIEGLFLIFAFTFISTFCKSYFMPTVDFNSINTITSIILYIDIIIMCLIYYLYSRKEDSSKKYGKLVSFLQSKNKMENIKHYLSKFTSNCYNCYSNFINCLRFNYCASVFFIITYGSILIIGYFFNRMIEISISVICFHIFRKYDNKTFHASTDVKCWFVSIISFSVIMLLSLPLAKSIICQILLAYILTTTMYCIEDYIDYRKTLNTDKALKPFEKLTEEEFYEVFKNEPKNDLKAIYSYIHRDRWSTAEHIANKYGMSRMTLYRITKKLKNKYHKI